MKGWGPKVRYVVRNPGKPNFLAGWDILGFCPAYPGGAKKNEKNTFVQGFPKVFFFYEGGGGNRNNWGGARWLQ